MAYFDYILVGSGIAGLYTALQAREHGSVLIITKGNIQDCNTRHAQGGIAAPIGANDTPELHFRDTIEAGAGLCDEEAVRILTGEAPDRIADLVKYGVPFDTVDGKITLTTEAAHSVPRILHAGGDATGEHIEVTLSNLVRATDIKVLEQYLATDILLENGIVKGVRVLDCYSGFAEEFECKWLILATGGSGKLFRFNTNSEIATGDGIALAYAAGAQISDMEFFQFHPTCLNIPGVEPFLISEAVRGEGGILRNIEKRRFMPDYTPDAELAPRDVVARSILYEMNKTGADHVYIDVTHLPRSLTTTRFPHIYRYCLENGVDITREMVPVAPAAHYMMGGVKVNSWGETNLPGLFATGEVACTGVHGANRLASNSMLEVLVFSKRILERTISGKVEQLKNKPNDITGDLSDFSLIPDAVAPTLPNLQKLMWNKVGIIRDHEGLSEAAATLTGWQQGMISPVDRTSYELNMMVTVARLMTEAALLREESRGAHFRSDFPRTAGDWERHIHFLRK